MKIALIGYGKMGHAIEKMARERGHEIVSVIDVDNQSDFESAAFRSADVAIEFSTPTSAFNNYLRAFAQGVKVVSGSTGWTLRLAEIEELCRRDGRTFFWTSNFSIGVNLFFAVNRYLASLMNGFPQYTPGIKEIHHIHKLDHPSGTAISLAEGIADCCSRIKGWSESETRCAGELLIRHEREGEVPGTHIVEWDSAVDSITIKHEAKSREGFALGAVVAAEWVATQSGFLTMDMLMHKIIGNGELLDVLK